MAAEAAESYYQCKMQLVRVPNLTTTGWIAARGAKVGALVEILPDKEIWKVVEVYTDTLQASSTLKERERVNRRGLPSIRNTTR